MIPQNTFPYLIATATILDIKPHPYRQQCNLWTFMMCKCENNQIESWQIQRGENETLHFIWLHMVYSIACAMLKHMSYEIKFNAQNH